MKLIFSGGLCATVFALGVTALAQSAGQAPAQPQTPRGAGAPAPQGGSSTDQEVTITGCVQSEADYRRSQSAGRGGVAGTGVGAANEFVLADAATPGAAGSPSAPTGTAGGSATAGNAYELTGQNEGQAKQFVGRRVQIVGKLKPAEVGAKGPTGGPTAGAPPRGVDVISQDLKLRELEVTSVRETTGTCPAARP